MRTPIAAVVMLTALARLAAAQTPSDLPLVGAEDIVYAGSFSVPEVDGTGRPGEVAVLRYGGTALGLGPDGRSLYFGCHPWQNHLARVSIAPLGGQATVLEPCTQVPNLGAVSDIVVLGGTLSWAGRLVLSAYAYYDANATASASHFAGAGLGSLAGPVRLGGASPGWVGGYMAVVPDEWRASLGGPALTGACCLSIISRTSYGPSVSVFDPADVGRAATVPSTLVLGYPAAHPLSGWDSQSELFNATTKIGGVAFPAGTRSVLFVGRQGTGPFCYGSACIEPNEPNGAGQGPHAYPYRYQVWAYDAADLVAVKEGRKAAWAVRPYATWVLPGLTDPRAPISSATYDPATRRLYLVADAGEQPLRVHVFRLAIGEPQSASGPELCGDGVDNDADGAIDEGCATPQGAPEPPVRLTSRVSGSTVRLSWAMALSGGPATDYVLEAGLAPGAAHYAVSLGSATSYAIPGVAQGRYYARVRARNLYGISGPSNEVAVTVGCRRAPAPVAALSAVPRDGLTKIAWVDPEGCSGTSYHIEVLDDASLPVHAMTTPNAAVSVLLPSGSYRAAVVAQSDLGTASSVEVPFTVSGGACPVPAFATTLRAEVGTRRVRLWWSPVNPALARDSDASAPLSYVLEVGSVAGGTDVAAIPLTRLAPFVVPAGPGLYFARLRPVNQCGRGTASNEISVRVH